MTTCRFESLLLLEVACALRTIQHINRAHSAPYSRRIRQTLTRFSDKHLYPLPLYPDTVVRLSSFMSVKRHRLEMRVNRKICGAYIQRLNGSAMKYPDSPIGSCLERSVFALPLPDGTVPGTIQ